MQRLSFLAALAAVVVVGCSKKPATVRFDAAVLRQALGDLPLSRLEIRVEALDFAEPIVVPVKDDAFVVSVTPGLQRRFVLDAFVSRDSGDGGAAIEVPAFVGERTLDVEAGADITLVIDAHPVGVIEAQLVTIDKTAVPAELAATLVHADTPWFDGKVSFVSAKARIVAPLGASTFAASFDSTTTRYAALETQVVTVAQGQVTAATIYLLKRNDRCTSGAPPELAPLGPACVPLTVDVSGLNGGTITLANDFDELDAKDGRSVFPTGVEAGRAYSVSIVDKPEDATCMLMNSAGVADATMPPVVTVECMRPTTSTMEMVTLRVRGLRGTLSAPLVVAIGAEMIGVIADGMFPVFTPSIDGAPLMATLTQPGASEVDSFNCEVVPAVNTVLDVRCMGDVQPAYPSFPDWLSWGKRADPTQACADDGFSSFADDCVHGAARVAHLYDRTDCAGVTAADGTATFEWSCEVVGDHIRVRSGRIKPKKGLTSVIDFASCTQEDAACAFIQQRLFVTEADGARQTQQKAWWQNQIRRDDDLSVGPSGSVGLITVSAPTGFLGTALNAYFTPPHVALVVPPTSIVSADGFNLNGDYDWLEGGVWNPVGAPVSGWLYLPSNRPTVRNLYVRGGPIEVGDQAESTNIEDVSIRRSSGFGLAISNTGGDFIPSGIEVRRVSVDSVFGAPGIGVHVAYVRRAIVEDIVAANNTGHGIAIEGFGFGTQNVHARRLMAFNNGGHGVFVDGVERASLIDITSFNNAQSGLAFSPASGDAFLANVTSANNALAQITLQMNGLVGSNLLGVNGPTGIEVTGATHMLLETLAAVAIDGEQLTFKGISAITGFIPELRRTMAHSGAAKCSDDSGIEAILKNSCTATGADMESSWPCGGDVVCTAKLQTAPTGPIFVGFVASDSQNPLGHVVDNPMIFSSPGMYDLAKSPWTTFENPRRGWVLNNPPAPYPANTQRGSAGDASFAIFDFRPAASGMLHDTLPLPTTADVFTTLRTTVNAPSPDQTFCTNAYPGTTAIVVVPSMSYACQATFLAGAVEIDDDGVGADNGFCEAGDDCVATTNFGAAQGQGALVMQGTVTVGAGAARLFRFAQTGF